MDDEQDCGGTVPSGAPGPGDDETVLLVGHAPGEHGVLREILCGAPHPLACRLCNGEQDCPYVASRGRGRVRVVHAEPPPVVPVVVHRRVATGMDSPSPGSAGVRAAAAVAWVVLLALVLRWWVLAPPRADELWGVAVLKLVVFLFAVVGVPLVRLAWAHHGGRFRGPGGAR